MSTMVLNDPQADHSAYVIRRHWRRHRLALAQDFDPPFMRQPDCHPPHRLHETPPCRASFGHASIRHAKFGRDRPRRLAGADRFRGAPAPGKIKNNPGDVGIRWRGTGMIDGAGIRPGLLGWHVRSRFGGRASVNHAAPLNRIG
jgi:hypothetical protein